MFLTSLGLAEDTLELVEDVEAGVIVSEDFNEECRDEDGEQISISSDKFVLLLLGEKLSFTVLSSSLEIF